MYANSGCGCRLQSRFHAPTAADAWLMQPTPATGLEASQSHRPGHALATAIQHSILSA